MKILIVSNSGHTEKYANMLAEKLNLKSIPLKKYKIDSEPIIFLGWLFANNIQGYKKVKDKANIKCTIIFLFARRSRLYKTKRNKKNYVKDGS